MQENRNPANLTKQKIRSSNTRINDPTPIDSISRADETNTHKSNEVMSIGRNLNLYRHDTSKIRAHFLMGNASCRRNSFVDTNSFKIRPYYLTLSHLTSKGSGKSINSKKITKSLVFISFFYAIFNFSYFLCFALYHFEWTLNRSSSIDYVHLNFMKAGVEISEIFMMANYSMIFILYSATGTIFRTQLKYSSK